MAKMKRCPICGSPVKPENLTRHLKKVHPGEKVDAHISKEEKKRIEAGTRRGVSRREGIFFAGIAIVIAVIVLLAFLYREGPPNMEGQPAPHFIVTDVTSHNVYRLPEDFYGEIVFLEFFAPSCIRCVEFVPTMQRLYDDYHADVEFMSIDVNTEDTEQVVKDFIAEHSAGSWIYGIDFDNAASDYKIRGTPHLFIIDLTDLGSEAEGIVTYDHPGADATYYEIASEFDGLLSP